MEQHRVVVHLVEQHRAVAHPVELLLQIIAAQMLADALLLTILVQRLRPVIQAIQIAQTQGLVLVVVHQVEQPPVAVVHRGVVRVLLVPAIVEHTVIRPLIMCIHIMALSAVSSLAKVLVAVQTLLSAINTK